MNTYLWKGFYMKFKTLICFLCFVLAVTSVVPAYATGTVDTLQESTNQLQNQLTGLKQELNQLGDEISSISAQASALTSEISQVKSELAIAKGQEEAQYEMMKSRIKYMYENGNVSMLEMLLNSSCMAEFLKRAEFMATVNEYDRSLLSELNALQKDILAKEESLIAEQETLATLQSTLAEKRTALQNKIASVSSDLAAQSAELEQAKIRAEEEAKRAEEEAKKAEEALKQEVKPVVPSKPSTPSTPNTPATPSEPEIDYAATASDLELFAALIECEAGSTDYEGMLAVASVVVNRMNHPYYPDTLRGVIYQSGQFPPAHNGSVDKKLKRGIKESCLQAAKDALAGKNNVGDCLSFRASSTGHAGTIIGDNVFF